MLDHDLSARLRDDRSKLIDLERTFRFGLSRPRINPVSDLPSRRYTSESIFHWRIRRATTGACSRCWSGTTMSSRAECLRRWSAIAAPNRRSGCSSSHTKNGKVREYRHRLGIGTTGTSTRSNARGRATAMPLRSERGGGHRRPPQFQA